MRGEMVAEQMRHECALPRPTVEVCLKLTFRTVATTDFTRGMVNERICRSAEIRVHHLEYCSAIFGILFCKLYPSAVASMAEKPSKAPCCADRRMACQVEAARTRIWPAFAAAQRRMERARRFERPTLTLAR